MLLLKEIPQVEEKIASGELSLSNVSQAQKFFREVKTKAPMAAAEKLEVLTKLENKSVRECQRELIKLQPEAALPKEKERILTETQSEVRFVMTDKLKQKLEEVRSLLGPKGTLMSYAELFEAMSDMSIVSLKAKKFGKKRTEVAERRTEIVAPSTSVVKESANQRYISSALKHLVWKRDGGECVKCASKRNLNFDHIQPVALGGKSDAENLRLLCFHCNQRAAIKSFGVRDFKEMHEGR